MATTRQDRNYPKGAQAAVRGEAVVLALGKLAPDPNNHNVMTSRDYAKLLESIRRYGFVDPLLVRQKKGKRGVTHETINGEHRLRAAAELGFTHIPCTDLGEVSDSEAEQLAIVTNDLHGSSDSVRLADRLRRINGSVPTAKLAEVMPYSAKEIGLLVSSVDFSFAHLSREDTRPKGDEEQAAAAKRLSFVLPVQRADRVLALLTAIDADHGRALELCVEAVAQELTAPAPAAVRKVRRSSKESPT